MRESDYYIRGFFTTAAGKSADYAERAEAVREQLAHRTKLSPEEILALATHGLNDVTAAHIKGPEDEEYSDFEIAYSGPGYQHDYKIDFEQGAVWPGLVKSSRNDRTTGRTLFANSVMVAVALGFEKRTLRAENMMGACTWPKAGVYVDPVDEKALARDLSARAQVLLPYLEEGEAARLKELCTLRKLEYLGELAAMDRKLAVSIHDFREAFRATDYTIDDYEAEGFFTRNSVGIGQFMLAGLKYAGYIDLRDDAQMTKLEQYTGKPVRAVAAEVAAASSVPLASIPPTQSAARSSSRASQTAHRL